MTCEEVRLHIEDGGAWTPLVSRPGFDEHIAGCAECAGFRAERDRLRVSFGLVRHAAPSIPLSLDQKVLRSYREHIRDLRGRGLRSRGLRGRRSQRPAGRFVVWALAWAPAAAFALAISYGEIAGFTRSWFTRTREAPPASAAASTVSSTGQTGARPQAPVTRARGEPTRTKRSRAGSREDGEPLADPAVDDSGALAAGFRGLMYCDELSCAGAMDVIRMRVPAEALGVPLGASPESQLVEADVLVGPDGVARGIRVVE